MTMSKPRIFLDAGHGGADSGAVGYVVEAEDTIKTVKYMAECFRDNYECEVYADTSADSLATITARANKWKADLFISIHENAGGGDGFECFVYSKARKNLGELFEARVLEVGQNSRGVKYEPELIVLNSTDMPAILLETAFVDNKKDIKDWDEPKELKKMAEAYCKATADYLKLKKLLPQYKVISNNLNIRESASTSSKIVGHLTKGAKIRGKEVKGGWLLHSKGYSRIQGKYKTFMEKVN